VGEAEVGEAGCGVRPVAPAVAGLLRRGAVVAQAVGLDDELQVRPVEVHAVAVHTGLRARSRQSSGSSKGLEAALESGVGEGEGASVEEIAELRHAVQAIELDEAVA